MISNQLRGSPPRREHATRGGFSLAALPMTISGALLPSSLAVVSIFQGETLDMVANVMSWVVLVVVPIVVIVLFWLVHILPEKIAEKREHPQAKAIQVLCLLSLAFGGMLWPLAWLWAYSKPVLYKMAYGVDRVPHDHGDGEAEELERLRVRTRELETKLASKSSHGGKV